MGCKILARSYFVFCCASTLLFCNGVPHGKGEESTATDDNLSRFSAPQLTKADKRHLAKLEDALTSKKGRLIFTNSWAVQLNPEQVALADQIAKRNGFHNMGQVPLFLIRISVYRFSFVGLTQNFRPLIKYEIGPRFVDTKEGDVIITHNTEKGYVPRNGAK